MANTPNLDLENINVLPDTSYVYEQIVSEVIVKTNNNISKIDTEINTNKTDILMLKNQKPIKNTRFTIGTSTTGWTEKDCNYLCDGIDDQIEINNAIQALPANGGEIVILDGIYNITAKINVNKSNINIKGNGNATILKRMYNSAVTEGLITLSSANYCTILNLSIDGNQANHTSNKNTGIYLETSSYNTITENTINNNKCDGITLYTLSNNNIITGNTCNNNYDGIYLYSANNNVISNNSCYNNYDGIFFFSESCNNVITGNIFMRGTGLTTDYSAYQNTIKLYYNDNNYNLISNNNCMGKAVSIDGGIGNTNVNNKFDGSDDIKKLEAQINSLATHEDVIYYINATTGLDTNNGLTSGTAFKTIQHAIDKLPQVINHLITINIAQATYNEHINITGLHGKGILILNGGINVSDNYVLNSIVIQSVLIPVLVKGVKSNTTIADAFGVSNCTSVTFDSIKADGVTASYNGVKSVASRVRVENCNISNKYRAIYCESNSLLYSNNNTGNNNTNGLVSTESSVIGKNGTQASATTSEVVFAGGVIR